MAILAQARDIFESLVESGFPGLEAMIGVQDEYLFLDFKEKARLEHTGADRSDKNLYSKALSGFSNAGGGVLVWGVECRRGENGLDVVQELKPISYVKSFVHDLNSYLPQAIQPLNSGVENEVIYVPGESDTGFVVTYVPESVLTPHRSLGDHLYYSRSGDNFIRVEHPMLADMFGRRQRPDLRVHYNIINAGQGINGTHCRIVVGIKNVGRYIARFPGIILYGGRLTGASPLGGLPTDHWGLRQIKPIGRNELRDGFMWFGGRDDVIHPSITVPVADIHRLVTVEMLQREQGVQFQYELMAEGVEVVPGQVILSANDICDAIGI